MTFIVVYQSEFEATIILNGRPVRLWHDQGNVRHVVKLMTAASEPVKSEWAPPSRVYMDDDTNVLYVEAVPA